MSGEVTDPQASTMPHDDTQPESTMVSSDSTPSAVFAELPIVPREHYKLVRELAHGGIGKITLALDLRLGREVAIKELRGATRYAKERFAREILIAAKLQHPNIVPVHEAGRWPNGEPFLVMKLVKGESLEAAIGSIGDRESRMQLMGHVANVADAIAYAHSQGVVHRDLKPANVLVGPFGETVVIDWGLAKDLNDPDEATAQHPPVSSHPGGQYQTADGVVVGTPSYMPAEQAAGHPVDARTDVYALGAILYHVLSGRAPYDDSGAHNVLARVLRGPPTPLAELEPALPRDLLALVAKAMARAPIDRYPSAREMAKELEAFVAGGLVAAYHYSLPERAWRFIKRNRAVVATVVLALGALIGLGAWSFARIAEQRDRAEHERERAERSAVSESGMRQQAERRLDEAILEAARAALPQDPTLALARLKRLKQPLAGAASVAADAVERGAAQRILVGHDDLIDTLAFSHDGRFLASASRDGRIRVWDRDKDAVQVLAGHRDRVPAVAFAPKQALLASAGYDGRVLLWKLPSGEKRALLEGKAAIRAVAFDNDGGRIAAVGDDGVRVWNSSGGDAIHLEAPADRPLFAIFHDSELVTGSHAHALRLWDLSTKKAVEIEHGAEIRDAARSPSGIIAAGGEDGSILIVNGRDKKVLRAHQGSVDAVAFFADGTLVSGGSDGAVRIWHDDVSEVVIEHAERVADLVTAGDTLASASWDRSIALYDRKAGTTRKLLGHRDVVAAVAVSPDGHTLASASWDQEVRLWPAEVDDARRILRGHQVGVKAVAFDPSSKLIASAGHDDRVRLWRESGELVRVYEGHRDHVFRVRFAPDGRTIASSSDDRSVRLWSVEGDDHHVLEGHKADVEELAFSDDGKWLASAGEDGAVGLWNVASASGRLLEGHQGAITAVAFAPDHARLASASRDGTIRIWEAASGAEKAVLRGHRGEVTSLGFTHTGMQLVSVGSDDTVRIWNVSKKS
ncbi:MAG TPA: serine/threonine-protein kinase, partial [Polyangiaceae bacterium]|nr:serine/threonine-protein kinase [Polyangiaceae bacterium]